MKSEPEQLNWPAAAVLIATMVVACVFVVGMNILPALIGRCQ